MIPCEGSSAEKQRIGRISKQGNSLLRFLLVEAAQAAARIHPDWRRRYIHLAMRRHKFQPFAKTRIRLITSVNQEQASFHA
jgi:transposase